MARALVQATLPHSNIGSHEFKRTNGMFKLTILADSDIGLPYGAIPRLLLAWISTEAVKTKKRHLILGASLSEFMRKIDLIPSGGRWGTITRLKDQMQRLFSSSISCSYTHENHWALKNVSPVNSVDLCWNPSQPNQSTIYNSTLTLNEDFFNEVVSRPLPIDLRAIKALKRSPLALDIYSWASYRTSYLNKSVVIPWEVLRSQFGSNYANDAQGTRNFKRHFIKELKKVYCVYKGLNIQDDEKGLLIRPSKLHVINSDMNNFVES